MIGTENPLHSVNDVFNAIFVRGNTLGDTMYYGRGAGKLPTASAVVADVVDCARNLGQNIGILWEDEKLELEKVDSLQGRFFVRMKDGSEAQVQALFGEVEKVNAGIDGEYGFVTDVLTEKEFADKAAGLEGFIARVRVEKD